MVKKAKIIDINNESTSYDDIAEVVNEEAETVEPDPTLTETPDVTPEIIKPKAKRASRTSTLKRSDSNMIVIPEPIPDVAEKELSEPEVVPEPAPMPAPKAKAKRVSKVKVIEESPPEIIEEVVVEAVPVVEKPKRVRKPKQPIGPEAAEAKPIQVVTRVSRAARREELYSNLVKNALP